MSCLAIINFLNRQHYLLSLLKVMDFDLKSFVAHYVNQVSGIKSGEPIYAVFTFIGSFFFPSNPSAFLIRIMLLGHNLHFFVMHLKSALLS